MVLFNCQAKITDFMKKAYCDYFGVKLGDQDKPFAPHVCFKICVENLRDWKNDKRMPFAIPMIWKEGKDHITVCYFCMINLKGINCKNKHHIQYSNIPLAIRPILHGPNLPVPEPDGNYSFDSGHSDMAVVAKVLAYKPGEDDQPVLLTQAELNDLIKNQNLWKESALLLGSHLKEKHLLAPGTMFDSFSCFRISYHWLITKTFMAWSNQKGL